MDEILYETFSALPRGGPGNAESTRHALEFIKDLPETPGILDVGCGTGLQTIVLAKSAGGHITALDDYAPLGEKLMNNAKKEGVESFIDFVCGSMSDMKFSPQSFDLIWSEGAIYNMGFENGLINWKRFLKPDGYIAVSEISWFKPSVPDEIKTYWDSQYPGMLDIGSNLKIIESSGYKLTGHFNLPEEAWWEGLYIPLENQITIMRDKYKNNEEVQKILDSFREEIELYRKYSNYYGYTFYIMKNN